MSLFSIFRKKKEEPFPFHELKVDMHSHLVPGIDDGAATEEDSFRLMEGLFELGYEKLITSPHIMQDLYPNTPDTINGGLAKLRKRYGPGKIQAAAEYFLDDHVARLLEFDSQLLTVKDNIVLIEFSFVSPPMGMRELIFQLQMKGYQPILAHPERYGYYHQEFSQYEDLSRAGCYLQCNLLSFTGYYGEMVRRVAEQLAERGMVDFLGTDLHHDRHLENLQAMTLTPALAQVLEKGVLNGSLI